MWELIEGLLEFIVLVIAGVFEVRASVWTERAETTSRIQPADDKRPMHDHTAHASVPPSRGSVRRKAGQSLSRRRSGVYMD